MSKPSKSDDAHPEVLISAEWARAHLHESTVRVVEVEVDTKQYDAGHIPGAVAFNWVTQLQDQVNRDIVSKPAFESLLSQAGIRPTDTIVLYGDSHTWFVLTYLLGFKKVKNYDGSWTEYGNLIGAPIEREIATPTIAELKQAVA